MTDRLIELREIYGFSQEDLARYLDEDKEYVQGLEDGSIKLYLSVLNKLSDLYNCTPAYILGRGGDLNFREYGEINIEDMKAIASMNRIIRNANYIRERLNE